MALTKAHNRMIAGSTANVVDYGADPSGVSDSTSAIQSALNSGLTVTFPNGNYLVSSSMTVNGDARLVFQDGAKVTANSGTYSTGYVFNFLGSATQISDLGSNASAGDDTVTFASAPDLSFGDSFVIYNPTNGSFLGTRNEYKAGEFCFVDSISGSTVNLGNALYDSYTTSAVDVYKVSPISVHIENACIESDGTPTGLIKIDYGKNVRITNPKLTHANNSCIFILRSTDVYIDGGKVYNEGDGGDDYGLSVANSQDVICVGGSYHASRHAVTTGGVDDVNSVPCRNIRFSNMILSNDRSSGTHTADLHGNSEYCAFTDCTIRGAVGLRGANVSLIDCNIYTGISVGVGMLASEVLGGYYKMIGNTFTLYADPNSTNRGVIDFGGNATAVDANTTRDLTVIFEGNQIVSSAFGSSTSMLLIRNRGTSKKINVKCENNTYLVNDMGNSVNVRLNSGTAASDFIISDNNTATVSGAYSISADGDYSALSVLRCQSHCWTDTVTTSTSAGYVTGTSETFTWAFPREPSVTSSAIDKRFIGSDAALATVNPVSLTAATLELVNYDSSNFTSVTDVKISGNATIKEV